MKSFSGLFATGLVTACLLVGGILSNAAMADEAAPAPAPQGSTPAPEPFPNQSIGILDINRILNESTAAEEAAKQRDKYLSKYQADAQKEEKALHDLSRTLARDQNQNTEAFAKKRQDFERKVTAFQQKYAMLRQRLDRAMAQALGQIQTVVVKEAETVANERSINLVVYKNSVFLFDPRMDMTEEVLSRVNDSLKSVTFPDPEKLPELPGVDSKGDQGAKKPAAAAPPQTPAPAK